MAVLQNQGIPLYHQLKELFIDKITSGEWRSGESIPGEVELCEQYGVSRRPVTLALEQLVREGLLTRDEGPGTRVSSRKIEPELKGLYSFTQLIEQRGMRSSTEILSFAVIQADGGARRWLKLEEDNKVYKIRRLRYADEEPMVLETLYIDVSLVPDFSLEILMEQPLYMILQEKYKLPLARARQFFEPTVADDFEAGVLKVAPGAPMLLIQNITYTTDNHPIVLSKSIMRGDRVRYFVELAVPADHITS